MTAPAGAAETISIVFAMVILWFVFFGGEKKGDD